MTLQRAVRTLDLNDAVQNLTATPIVAFHEIAVENGWIAMAVRDGLTDRPHDPETLGLGRTIQASTTRRDTSQRWAILGENCAYLVHIDQFGELWSVVVTAAAETLTQARALAEAAVRSFPARAPLADHSVRVAFWAHGKHGPFYKSRKITAPTWEEIAGNYSAPTRAALADAMRLTPPIEGGQLLLFHGDPGSGKSWGIRALLREWKSWCHASYIVDPDRFFSEAEYMLNVTMDAAEELMEESTAPEAEYEDYHPRKRERLAAWHLLVVEDADDFVGLDAKTRTGQSLGRLLNMVDGLVGQGLRLLVLLTANEQVGRMHPALVRTGRCLANINFTDLTTEEARAWGEHNGVAVPLGTAKLNALYALKRHPITTTTDGAKPGVVP